MVDRLDSSAFFEVEKFTRTFRSSTILSSPDAGTVGVLVKSAPTAPI